MTHYHVLVELEDDWYVGRVLERSGITTQGRSLDDLVEMVRDAIETLWGERQVRLELVLPAAAARTRNMRSRRPRRRAA